MSSRAARHGTTPGAGRTDVDVASSARRRASSQKPLSVRAIVPEPTTSVIDLSALFHVAVVIAPRRAAPSSAVSWGAFRTAVTRDWNAAANSRIQLDEHASAL